MGPETPKEENVATLKKPLVALLIAPDNGMRQDIIAGIKQITIREGYREGYDPGRPVILCCEKDPWCVMADITKVRHCLLSEVTEEEWRADGYASREELLTDMRRFYPDMTWDSAVTIVSWNNVRGRLVDLWRNSQAGAWAGR
jgi:hypothetical protein